jgi:hypothetical protein
MCDLLGAKVVIKPLKTKNELCEVPTIAPSAVRQVLDPCVEESMRLKEEDLRTLTECV